VVGGVLISSGLGYPGRATGPHLHFEVRRNEVALNPSKFLQADLQHLPKIARSPGSNPG
jgi:murein DD-endopeptidase MepM/ murein hydrolase activator NlpD